MPFPARVFRIRPNTDVVKIVVRTKRQNVTGGAVPGHCVEDLETRFEKAAMKRLGGSIAFVAKKKVNWDLKD